MRGEKINGWLEKWRDQIVGTLPVIVFFIALFWIVQLGFGDTYLLAVSPFTTLFETRLEKYNPPGQYARFFLVSALALVGARLAVTSVALCVVVNLAMPFALVFMRSSQLNPRRYFPYTMLFAFLQLRPGNLVESFATQAAVLAACCVTLSVGLLAAGALRRRKHEAHGRLHACVRRLANDLGRAAADGIDDDLRAELLSLRREFAALAYSAREDSTAPPRTTNLLDMLATLAQRTAYLTGNFDWSDRHRADHAALLAELSKLTRELDLVIDADADGSQRAALAARSQELLRELHVEEPRFRIFCRSYLNMLALIVRVADDPQQRAWHMSATDVARTALFRKRPSLDSFEMRFSVRCGVVLAVSCSANLLLPVDHLYWYVLHAYLLLQPFPDESSRRMRTRMTGTALGCVFVHAVALLNLGWAGIMVLGMVLVAPLYAATPGTVTSAFFATAYAVTMASVSIDDGYATMMRLGSLVLAVVTVALVNRLVLPTSDRRLLAADVRQLFAMVRSSWDLVRTTLYERVDTVVSSERLLHFQMVHTQANAVLDSISASGERTAEIAEVTRYRDAADRMLFCLWEISCELEQLELMVRMGAVLPEERATFEKIIDLAEAHCDPERFGTGVDRAEELVFGLSDEDLRYVLQQYIDRAGELRLAVDEARGALVKRPRYLDEVRR
ncbi:MAG TPA: FUSC family protein [Candidatus Olsenella pullistercoris]|uniref:FUSC family protein n=1 Tax=Candidatus Olsenella pullistercoris TaxID=2838712 RepID=A0A9D2EX30_9ACTN|nr:FUSC family protein [Candidatus Olsenella pullistercoris]